MPAGSTVFVLADDSITQKSYCQLLIDAGLGVEIVPLEDLAQSYAKSRPACLIARHSSSSTDPQNTLQLLKAACDRVPPTIVVTSRIGVATVVGLMESGAFTVFQSPIPDATLVESLNKAIEVDRRTAEDDERIALLISRRRRLSDREREIAELIVEGKSNRQVATTLEIAVRTVEANRSRIFNKFGVESLGELASEWTELRLRESWNEMGRTRG